MATKLINSKTIFWIFASGASLGFLYYYIPNFFHDLWYEISNFPDIPHNIKNNDVKVFEDLSKFRSDDKNIAPTQFKLMNLSSTMKIQPNCIDKKALNQINKNTIPYSIDDREISKNICKLPKSTPNTHYWTDIYKDNENGEITITIYGRVRTFHSYILNDMTYDKEFESHKITGFKKKDPLEIIKERIVGVYLNWNVSPLTKYFYFYDTFVYKGSGVIFNKDPTKPKYYIFTNKHLFPDMTYQLKDSGDKKSVISPIDYNRYLSRNDDFKNFITFGSPIKDKRRLIINEDDDSKIKTYQSTFLNKSSVKEIRVVKDFSENFKKERKEETSELLHNLNKNYDDLVTIHGDKKITLDAIIFSVEFVDDANDPYKSWWRERPTKYRLLEEQDFDNHNLEQYLGSNHKQIMPEKVYTAGFQWNKFQNVFTDVAVAKGDLVVSRYDFENQRFNNYNPYGKSGIINYPSVDDRLKQGSSGGGVFDKNLKIIGIHWGGNDVYKIHWSVFNWWGINPQLQAMYDSADTINMPEELKNWQKASKVYNYIDLEY